MVTQKSKHAALTIVSKNYFAFALTLAESFLAHHKEHDFIIVLVDRNDDYIPKNLPRGVEVIELANIAIPDLSRFVYRYSIMELNTAVKPFAMKDILTTRSYETLLYIDPDIFVFAPMTEVYLALNQASIVLTPHLRRPFYDDSFPSDLSILQSGTYNLGFLGLRNTDSAHQMLDWWMTKLNLDCIVDIPNGLFVDQKWMDLVPGFFPDHAIVYHPGYNAAYWNLHDRELTRENNKWVVEGEPLVFFHFSGYVPYAPNALSKHQNRHDLRCMPELKALSDEYASALKKNHYEDSRQWPYAFSKLGNGVKLPLELVRDIMQWAIRNGVSTPCPFLEPDRFCDFLMSQSVLPDKPKATLVWNALLQKRTDVAAAFPGALEDTSHAGFQQWLNTSGKNELEIDDLMARPVSDFGRDLVAEIFANIRASGRGGVLGGFEKMWSVPSVFNDFIGWVQGVGAEQLRLTPHHTVALRRAMPDVTRILNIYFLRADLQNAFRILWEPVQISALCNWLREHRYTLGLSDDSISLFGEYANARRSTIDLMRFLYFHGGQSAKHPPTLYSLEPRRNEVASVLDRADIVRWLVATLDIKPTDHYLAIHRLPDVSGELEELEVPGMDQRANFDFSNRVASELSARSGGTLVINVTGYFSAPSGMGESARSMLETLAPLAQRQLQIRTISLPHPLATGEFFPTTPAMFGWPASFPDLTINIANADAVPVLDAFLPASYWGKRNVGYWVWETEALPRKFSKSEKRFDEIWTASQYSADAIAKVVSCPVRVLPHTIDFAAIDAASANRVRFHMPTDGILFGFSFDPLSVIERKNVAGLISAFNRAFTPKDNCYLIIKANGKPQGIYDYDLLRANCRNERVLFMDGTLSRADTFSWMKSLDAYVSLHRAEGFGLTCAEAMALSLPVVATKYSGNLEFMTDQNSLLVTARTIKTNRPFGAYPTDTKWAEPDLDDAASKMRLLLNREYREKLGAVAAKSIRETLNPSRLADIASAYITALCGRPLGKN
jgi:glycosyltransferase involved in cell wall biosynthesis